MFQILKDINIDWLGSRRVVYRYFRVDHARWFGIGDLQAGDRRQAFNLGVDFKGGTVVTARFKQKPGDDRFARRW